MNDTYTAMIRNHVQAIETLLEKNGIINDYGVTALSWLEMYIDQHRPTATPVQKRWMIEAVGSFFGECLCRAYSGVWVEVRQELSLQMADGRVNAFPLIKVAKFVSAGSSESFVRLFLVIPGTIKQAMEREPKPAPKPIKIKKSKK